MKNYHLMFFLLSSVVLFLTACKPEKEVNSINYPTPVKLFKVNVGNTDKEITLPAVVQAAEKSMLSFRVGGQVNEVFVNPGEQIKKGVLLATIDSSIYEQKVNIASAEYELARVFYNRANLLVKKGYISKADFDSAKSELLSAKSTLEQAKKDNNYTRLTSPFDGEVISSYVEEYEFVKEKQIVFGMQTKSEVDLSFQLPEHYIAMLDQGKTSLSPEIKTSVKFEGNERWYKATFKEINTVADQTTASYTIVVSMSKPESINLLPDMVAQVRLSVPNKINSAQSLIPSSALVNEDEQTFVFRWDSERNTLNKVEIKVDGNRLLEGLNDGDWVVETGVSELSDGQSAIRWIKERGL